MSNISLWFKRKKAVHRKRTGAEVQLRTPKLGAQADKVSSSIPHLLGLESLTNALSSKSNWRNISVEWPHCFSTLLQDVQCKGNLRSLDTFCARRWRIDSNKPTKTNKVKNVTKTQAHTSLCCQYAALSCLGTTATNIHTVQCSLFYPLPLFEPHREGIKLFTDTHIALLHNAIIVYSSDLKKVWCWILLIPMQCYIRIFWRPKVHVWDARPNERCCQLRWHTPPSLQPPFHSLSQHLLTLWVWTKSQAASLTASTNICPVALCDKDRLSGRSAVPVLQLTLERALAQSNCTRVGTKLSHSCISRAVELWASSSQEGGLCRCPEVLT